MSFKTSRALTRLREGLPVERVFGERHRSVRSTFLNYSHRVLHRWVLHFDGRPSTDFTQPFGVLSALPRYPRNDLMYAYLWRADLGCRKFFKVGVTRDVGKRFQTFSAGLPPKVKVRPVSLLLFENSLFAEACEWSVLALCVDAWIGGEWLCERRKRVRVGGGTDGR